MDSDYHVHLPLWPSMDWTEEERASLPDGFAARLEEIDGDLPSVRLSSWRQFHDFVGSDRFKRDEYIFRGHQRNEWDLVPSLARGSEGGVFTLLQSKSCLESFRRAARGRKDVDPTLEDDLEMWALGQHHGLKTPLLDWTVSPYVALFFAFEKPDASSLAHSDSRVVFALNTSKLQRIKTVLLSDHGYQKEQILRVFQPEGDSNRRLLSQAGLFLAVPAGQSVTGWILTHLSDIDDVSLSDILLKVHIPNNEREDCLRTLHQMNIHHASLFPDLIGSSAYTNFEFDVYRPADG